MKNFLKIAFSRLGIFALAIIMQILFIVLFLIFLARYYFIASIIMSLISLVALFSLEFRSMHIEGKVTWIILILLFPVFGVILYLMFSKNHASKKQKELFYKIQDRNKEYNVKSKGYNTKYKKLLGDKYFSQAEYVYKVTDQRGYNKTRSTFYKSGEDFIDTYLEDLKKATKFIFIESFIISKGKMLNQILNILDDKVEKGVEVRILYDDLGSISGVPGNFAKKLRQRGYKCYKFHPFIPIIASIHNNRDHRKITIIDGKIAYTGGINIGDEYINVKSRFGYWNDCVLRVEGEAVDEFTEMFLTTFAFATNEIDDLASYTGMYENFFKGDGVMIPFGDGPRPIYKEYVAENVLLNLINGANSSIYITTPYLIIDEKLKTALQLAAMRNIDVRIITPHIPDKKIIFEVTRSSYKELQEKGVKIYEYEPGFIHAKQVLIDQECALIGSINLDYRSLVHNYEVGCILYQNKSVKDIKDNIDKIISQSIDMKDYKQGIFTRILCKIIEIFEPMF